MTTRHPQSERFHALLKELGATHDQKQKDYGREDAPFANCQASVEWDVPAWVGTMIRANDKMRRLQTYAKTGALSNEGARDSFIDLAVYTLIALCLWEDDCVGCDTDTQKDHNFGCPQRGYVPAA